MRRISQLAYDSRGRSGDRLTEEEVVATCIVTMVGGLETTTNLIGNGVLTSYAILTNWSACGRI